jgi:hypothetical protein
MFQALFSLWCGVRTQDAPWDQLCWGRQPCLPGLLEGGGRGLLAAAGAGAAPRGHAHPAHRRGPVIHTLLLVDNRLRFIVVAVITYIVMYYCLKVFLAHHCNSMCLLNEVCYCYVTMGWYGVKLHDHNTFRCLFLQLHADYCFSCSFGFLVNLQFCAVS